MDSEIAIEQIIKSYLAENYSQFFEINHTSNEFMIAVRNKESKVTSTSPIFFIDSPIFFIDMYGLHLDIQYRSFEYADPDFFQKLDDRLLYLYTYYGGHARWNKIKEQNVNKNYSTT